MFDALAHGLPFVASKLSFFKEFAAHNLGILARNRDSKKFQLLLKCLIEIIQSTNKQPRILKKSLIGFCCSRTWQDLYESRGWERKSDVIASTHNNIF
jgi:hypothetical protein